MADTPTTGPGSVQPFNTLPTEPDPDYDLETAVMAAMDADPNYPLGETDAMKWAIAWRITRDRNGIDANGADTDGWMVGWFANAMTSADPKGCMIRESAEA